MTCKALPRTGQSAEIDRQRLSVQEDLAYIIWTIFNTWLKIMMFYFPSWIHIHDAVSTPVGLKTSQAISINTND